LYIKIEVYLLSTEIRNVNLVSTDIQGLPKKRETGKNAYKIPNFYYFRLRF